MSLLSKFLNVFSWFKKNVIDHVKSTAIVAVTITEGIKTLLANPLASFLENVADTITNTQLPTEIATALNSVIPKILAVELAIVGLPDNPQDADVLAFENRVLGAFNVNSDNSKLYTVLGAQVYGIINTLAGNPKANFADYVTAIEQAYSDYKTDLASNASVTE